MIPPTAVWLPIIKYGDLTFHPSITIANGAQQKRMGISVPRERQVAGGWLPDVCVCSHMGALLASVVVRYATQVRDAAGHKTPLHGAIIGYSKLALRGKS